MDSTEFTLIMNRLDEIEKKIEEPPGHFFIIIMLLLIMSHIGAC
jgi:tetrahydromethanopterin S-methyltransferase subunit G